IIAFDEGHGLGRHVKASRCPVNYSSSKKRLDQYRCRPPRREGSGQLKASRHKKNLNPSEVYTIKYIEFNMIDAMKWLPIQKENPVIRTASVIARYLAGVIFLVFGLNGFLNFIPLPPPGGIAGQFMGALYASHYLWVIFAFQVIAGVLLLVNGYVPLAVSMLSRVILKVLFFHALMD